MRPRVVLIGLPGAGKSTIGRRLSRALGLDLVDSDELIEQRWGGVPCGRIFDHLGEDQFRVTEEDVIADALMTSGIVALGGGAVLSAATRRRLVGHEVVFLDVSAEEGCRRTCGSETRPVLYSDDPEQKYRELERQRRPLYEEVATLRIRSDRRSPQKVVGAILNYLEASESRGSMIPDAADDETAATVEEFL
ncbi:shikimate kinase [Corynebacterium kroppenstedtii]|uniref:shikimate kinase n=1 Tax=Corynebacterium sp. PCR 32 TaxID=3351342 RepID=UPI0030ABE901